jgi:hypothetical protein
LREACLQRPAIHPLCSVDVLVRVLKRQTEREREPEGVWKGSGR